MALVGVHVLTRAMTNASRSSAADPGRPHWARHVVTAGFLTVPSGKIRRNHMISVMLSCHGIYCAIV
jgi:hypothetical protein